MNTIEDAVMKTTLNEIRRHIPCKDGWEKLLSHLGKTEADDEPLSLLTVLDSNGLDDALWCLRAVTGHDKEIRLYTVWCARQVQHLMTDPRSVAALDVAERHANGEATDRELAAARDTAEVAAAEASARDAAWVAVEASALDAERDALDAAWAARDAVWIAAEASARDAAWDAARDAQEQEFRAMLKMPEDG